MFHSVHLFHLFVTFRLFAEEVDEMTMRFMPTIFEVSRVGKMKVNVDGHHQDDTFPCGHLPPFCRHIS